MIRMLFAVFFSLPALAQVPVVEPLFSDEICEDFQQIAREYLDLELAGSRWQGGDSNCLKKLKLKTLLATPAISIADPSLLDPELILPLDRKVDLQVKRLPGDLLEIRFGYIGKKNKTDVPIRDLAILKLNFNRARDLRGCASPYQSPAHFVMRKGCSAD